MITLNEVQKVIKTAKNIEIYNNTYTWGIKVYYTGRAPMWKPEIIKIGNYYFKWHYDEFPVNDQKIRCYINLKP